jgi:large subunit ribosomal protein L27
LNVKRAGDDTLFSTADGVVKFSQKGKTGKIVNVLPVE